MIPEIYEPDWDDALDFFIKHYVHESAEDKIRNESEDWIERFAAKNEVSLDDVTFHFKTRDGEIHYGLPIMPHSGSVRLIPTLKREAILRKGTTVGKLEDFVAEKLGWDVKISTGKPRFRRISIRDFNRALAEKGLIIRDPGQFYRKYMEK